MEELINRKAYSEKMALDIEGMGATAISIANRWIMGWPKNVDALLKAQTYLSSLEAQVEQEKEILANEANLRHLTPREILQMYEIRVEPPLC